MAQPLLTINDLMRLLRVTRGTLRSMRVRGDLPAELKTGLLVRWNPREVDKWISEGTPNREVWEAMVRRNGWTF